uniref:S-protein homolog n=2 Tax=Lotus japonicus TaxID=34305 RepID=I3SJB6_LOTJA|nr:unknown [Lotus japonicus]
MLIVPVHGRRNTVRITNDLKGSGFTQLLVHCGSKDDDLGIHYLQSGQSFQWSFKDNIWGTTLFWCHLGWNSVSQTITAYRYSDDSCGSQCWRSIRPDGAYFYSAEPFRRWDKKYSW